MKVQKQSTILRLKLLFLSYFGLGYAPKAPGTVGSLFTIPLFFLVNYLSASFEFVLIFTIILTVVACYVADSVQKELDVQDPGWIVMDEVIGMLVTWLFIFPNVDPPSLIVLFIAFRFFDIVKIQPAKFIDTKMKSGAGTILDDVVSAVYAGLVVLLYQYASSQF